MIDQKFGPPPPTFEIVLDMAAEQDPLFAQSLYDVQVSGYYGYLNLDGFTDPHDLYEPLGFQHVFWDPNEQRIRGQGMLLDRGSLAHSKIAEAYAMNARNLRYLRDEEEPRAVLDKSLRALNAGSVATFAAWEFVQTPRNIPGALRLVYPRFDFTNPDDFVLSSEKSAAAMPQEDLDLSVILARLASAVAYRN